MHGWTSWCRCGILHTLLGRLPLFVWLSMGIAACGGAQPPPDPPALPPLQVRIEEIGAGSESEFGAAEQARVARSVAERQAIEHGALPEPVREGAPTPDAWPRVTVVNDTPFGIVVWISGACARELVLPAQGHMTSEICEGHYDLAAQVGASDYVPLVAEGSDFENGFAYTFTFYVVSESSGARSSRRRRSR